MHSIHWVGSVPTGALSVTLIFLSDAHPFRGFDSAGLNVSLDLLVPPRRDRRPDQVDDSRSARQRLVPLVGLGDLDRLACPEERKFFCRDF